MFLKKAVPPLYSSLGIFLPLITTNCAVLGVAIVVQREGFDLGTSTYYSFATGLGFMLALILLAAIRERLEISRLPLAMRGVPAALVLAGIMSMSFMAFSGMI
jgi:electron transport complex protein RnfA